MDTEEAACNLIQPSKNNPDQLGVEHASADEVQKQPRQEQCSLSQEHHTKQQAEQCRKLDPNKEDTRYLLLSAVHTLALSDDNLTLQEETQLVSATTIDNADLTANNAGAVGKQVCGHDIFNELERLLSTVRDFIDSLLDDCNSSGNTVEILTKFFTKVTKALFKYGITKALIISIVLLAYGIIRHYLKKYIGKDVLRFIEQMVIVLYRVFIKCGVLDWIMSIGGWKMLKSVLYHITLREWAIITVAGSCIFGLWLYILFT